MRQYVGARYVPKFFENPNTHDTQWLSGASYEALTIVTYLNNTYTSKKPVPASVGSPADNPAYWAVTGNYNAQVQEYHEEVENAIADMHDSMETFEENLTEDNTTFKNNLTQQQTDFESNISTRQNNFELSTGQTIQQYKNDIDASEAAYKTLTDADLASMQTQIDNLVVSAGDSSAEVLQARGSFSTLNDRLSTMLGTNKAQTNIDELFSVGVYSAIVPSTYNSQLGIDVDDYFFTAICYKPATAIAGDVIQMIIATGKNTHMVNHVYTRSSYGGNWSNDWTELSTPTNVMTVSSSRNVSIDNATTIGVYGCTVPNTYNNALGVDVSNYYFTVMVMEPATLASQDVIQLLIGCNTNTPYVNKVWMRSSYSGNWSNPFTELTNPDNVIKYFTTSVSIDDANVVGIYRGAVPSTYASELGLDLQDYWFTLFVTKPATLDNQDVVQILIANSTNNRKTQHVFIRNSYGGHWTVPFVELTNGSVNNKVMFCGDSFTANNITKSYADFLDEWGYCKSTIKAFGGASAQTWFARFEDDITDDYDTFFVALGLNNVGGSIGYITDAPGTDSFVGGMKSILNTMISVNPKARIIIFVLDSWMNTIVSDLSKQLADMYGCEYYSMKADASIPVRLQGKFAGVMENLSQTVIDAKNTAYRISVQDGHPNVDAQKMLASYLRHII